MFLEERQEIILNMLARDGKVRVRDLSEKFKVTEWGFTAEIEIASYTCVIVFITNPDPDTQSRK